MLVGCTLGSLLGESVVTALGEGVGLEIGPAKGFSVGWSDVVPELGAVVGSWTGTTEDGLEGFSVWRNVVGTMVGSRTCSLGANECKSTGA